MIPQIVVLRDPPAGSLSPESRGSITQAGVRMNFARGEEIYAQEEDADLIYEVISGAVRTARFMTDGRRQIGDFYYPGDVFGLEVGAAHLFSAEALSHCVVAVAKRAALDVTMGRDRAQDLLARALTAEFGLAQNHLLLLGRKTACERVASFLLDAAARHHGRQVDLPMGRQDIADYLGLTIETVSRMVSQLQATGVIEFKTCRTFVIRDHAALHRLSE